MTRLATPPTGFTSVLGHFRQCGYLTKEETGSEQVTFDLAFRQATNGVIVNTLVNGEPIITTSAGQFH